MQEENKKDIERSEDREKEEPVVERSETDSEKQDLKEVASKADKAEVEDKTPSAKKRTGSYKPPKSGGGVHKKKFDKKKSPENAEEDDPIIEQVIKINRVTKVVKGGKNFSFSAMVVAGDGCGSYGMGFGKSNEVVGSIRKGSVKARRKLKKVNLKGDTIPHEVIGRYKASRVMLKPAGRGTGVIAGGPVRALCDAVGVKNILTKSLGSRNAINVAKAAADGFDKLRLRRKG